ncbi:MAG: lipid A biosynthesis acyltransferase [Rhodospirillales bacterium]|nr:lipid A biosynthesis acyltransferase [Rhodospirillales bacterium]
MSQAWQRQPERGSTGALSIIHWIGTRIGRRSARALLYPISLYFLLTAGDVRRASRRYLRRILRREPGWTSILRHIHCFASTILDRVFLLTGQFERFDIRVHNGAIILDQVASGSGALLLSAHLGSFEVLRAMGITGRQLPVKVLMNVDHNSAMTRFTNALNPQMVDSIIPIQGVGTLLAVKEALDQGFLVGVLGDRVVRNDRAIACAFLGRPAAFPVGPLMIASALGCRVILAFSLYRGGNRYDIYFEPLADSISTATGRSAKEIAPWLQVYADRLAWHTRLSPYNWFNFFDFWADERRDERT